MGEDARALIELQRVMADARRGEAPRLAHAAALQLRRLGVRPAETRVGPLTTREQEVAALAAQGHSNKRISSALYLSEKTVANTLTRVYAKYGVRCRTELAHVYGRT